MSTDLNQRLRVLGDHLEQERRAAADHSLTVQVVPNHHVPRGRTLVTAAAAALVAFGLGVTFMSRHAPATPAVGGTECTVEPAPSLFDGGVAMIVFVDTDATDSQIAFIRNAISDHPDVIDSARIEYFDVEASEAEARRVVTDPLELEQLLAPNVLPTMFKLFTTPTAAPSALRNLVVQFEQISMVIQVQTAPNSTDASASASVVPQYLPPPETVP